MNYRIIYTQESEQDLINILQVKSSLVGRDLTAYKYNYVQQSLIFKEQIKDEYKNKTGKKNGL